MDRARRHADEGTRSELLAVVADADGQRALEDIEHVVESVVDVRRRS